MSQSNNKPKKDIKKEQQSLVKRWLEDKNGFSVVKTKKKGK